jgi:hypothetical protein
MSSFLTYEGTSDYLAATPALIITLTASGSIAAGRGVVFDTGTNAAVYQPSAIVSGSLRPAGIALATRATGDAVPVMVWGYAKSLPASGQTFTPGDILTITGSGLWGSSGSAALGSGCGKIISGSSGYIYALVDFMRNL